MGCLKSILKKILIILLIAAFFTLGGWAFCKKKISEYKNPPREVFVETEKEFADFAYVSGDYQLCRCFNFFGFKKIVAKYLPTSQKIAIYDLKDEELIHINSPIGHSPYIFNFSVMTLTSEVLVHSLEDKGFCVSTISACGSKISHGSYIIKSLFNNEKYASSSIRVSLAYEVKEEDIDKLIKAIKEIIRK